jgi:heme-degrading monooxygenase HmoA
MPLVSITRLRVRSWRYLLPFLYRALQSARQAKAAEGSLAVSVLRQPRSVFWTRTVWISEEAMKSFMLSGPHRQVMRRLLEWCDEAAVAHWTQQSSEPPSWPEAHRRLQQEGRASKVNHPSEHHRAYQIPPLHFPIRGEGRLK